MTGDCAHPEDAPLSPRIAQGRAGTGGWRVAGRARPAFDGGPVDDARRESHDDPV
jgi:hypothetical protein